ncbi:MAG: hypothetical protein ACJ8ER_00740 [Allosphingosinicella sp.]
MKKAAFAIALLVGGAAFAQTGTYTAATTDSAASTAYEGDGVTTAAYETEGTTTSLAGTMPISGSPVVQPSNSSPERDARGIAVISDPATVPAGWNGVAGSAEGGPLLDPVTGEPMADTQAYPACTASVTDHCLQTYEKGRRAR